MKVPLGDTYYFKFTSRSFSTGAPTTLAGTPVISVYEENNLTQITTGVTLTADYDSVTGLNDVAIVATSGNGYEVGKYYDAVITTGTVGGVSVVGETVGHFRIMPAEDAGAGIPDVNITHYGDTAGTFSGGRPEVNASHFAGTAYATALAAEVDAVWDEVLSAAAHNVANSAGRRLRQLQDNGLYALAAVWVDEVNGTSTGTTNYEDATVTNRSNDFDNAQTVATSLFLNRIYPANGNSITLTATINNFQIGIPGGNWTLALGGQDIGGCDINDAVVSGTCTGTDPHFHNCEIGTVTVPPCKMYGCGIVGAVTLGSAGNFDIIDCESLVAGASAPVIDMGAAVGATNMSIRRWSGGLTLNNVQTGDVISVDCVSGGTITVNGTGGTVHVRGMVAVSDGSSGAVTIVQTQAISNTSINAECDTALTDYDAATGTELAAVDAKMDIVDANVDLVLEDTGTTLPGLIGTPVDTDIATDIANAQTNITTMVNGIIEGTAQTGTLSTTQATTNLTGYGDDQLIGRVITWLSGNCDGESTDITDYASASGLLTYTALTTAPANGDTFKIT